MPFGMQMPNRNGSTGEYRYGFQGQEKDDEIKGDGNSINYKYRMHDPRTGRFYSVDPLASDYSYNSPYVFSENRVIDGVELEGLEFLSATESLIFMMNGELFLKTENFGWPVSFDKSTHHQFANSRYGPAWGLISAGYDKALIVKDYSPEYFGPNGLTTEQKLNTNRRTTNQSGGKEYDKRQRVYQHNPKTSNGGRAFLGINAVVQTIAFTRRNALAWYTSEKVNQTKLYEPILDILEYGFEQGYINLDKYLNQKGIDDLFNVILYGGDENISKETKELGIFIFQEYNTQVKKEMKGRNYSDYEQNKGVQKADALYVSPE